MIFDEDVKKIVSDTNIDWEALRGANVLVTGATGLIGSICIKAMLHLDYPVNIYALVRDPEKAKALLGTEINYVVGDVRKPIDINVPLDYIIHCASVTKSKMMIEVPVETLDISINGTKNLLDLAKKHDVKSIVYASSMEAYGVTTENQNPITEEKLGYIDLSSARSSYSEGKRVAECLCSAYYHQFGIPIKVVRLALTMGAGIPLSDNRVAMQFARSVVNNEDIVLHTEGKSISNFCYTTDSIRGIFTVLLKGKNGETYNVCNDKETRSIREIAELVRDKVANGRINVKFDIPEKNCFGYAPDTVLKLSSNKLIKLGWTPEIDMKFAYKRLVKYIRGE